MESADMSGLNLITPISTITAGQECNCALSAHVTVRTARTACKAIVLEFQIKSVQPHRVHAGWQQIESDARLMPHIKRKCRYASQRRSPETRSQPHVEGFPPGLNASDEHCSQALSRDTPPFPRPFIFAGEPRVSMHSQCIASTETL